MYTEQSACAQTDHIIDIAVRYTACIIPLSILVHSSTFRCYVASVTQSIRQNTQKSGIVKSLPRSTTSPLFALIRLLQNPYPSQRPPAPYLTSPSSIPTLHNKLLSTPLTSLPKPPLPNRLRKHPLLHQLEKVPLTRTALSLEIPKHPAKRVRLERIQLRLNVPAHAVPPSGRPVPDTSRQAGAGADQVGAGEGAFAAVPCAEAVEVLCAVCQRGGPFAHDGPFVGCGVGGGLVAVSEVARSDTKREAGLQRRTLCLDAGPRSVRPVRRRKSGTRGGRPRRPGHCCPAA